MVHAGFIIIIMGSKFWDIVRLVFFFFFLSKFINRSSKLVQCQCTDCRCYSVRDPRTKSRVPKPRVSASLVIPGCFAMQGAGQPRPHVAGSLSDELEGGK